MTETGTSTSEATKWGKDYAIGLGTSKILAENIDDTVTRRPKERERFTQEYSGMIVTPLLRDENVPVETLEHLDVQFVDIDKRKSNEEVRQISEEDELKDIKRMILRKMGTEILRRIDLSLSKNKVRFYTGSRRAS